MRRQRQSVLITGGAGYIGAHMALNLVEAGKDVVVLDSLVTGFDTALDARAHFLRGDVNDAPLVAELIERRGVTDIIHFAGSAVVPDSIANPLAYYANNTAASRTLIETAVSCKVERFIFSSTAAVYGNVTDGPVRETRPPAPVTPYGRSKLMTEWMLADTAATGALRYGILRYFNVAGADPQGRIGQSTLGATHLIKAACQAALGLREQLEIFGTDYPTPDGTCIRDFIHVTDLVSAHRLVMDHLRSGGSSVTYNCGYGRGFSVREVIEAVQKAVGAPFPVRERARRAGDCPAVVADISKLTKELRWTPRHDSLQEIVDSALAWEKQLADVKQGK